MITCNAVEKAESMEGKIPSRFSLSCKEAFELSRNYKGVELVAMAFRLGFMQGMKAAKAEQKRKEATACKK